MNSKNLQNAAYIAFWVLVIIAFVPRLKRAEPATTATHVIVAGDFICTHHP